jgi:hypothetical protein
MLLDFDWWFSVVIVGILVGVASSYLKDITDRLLGKISQRAKLSDQRIEQRARLLLADPLEFVNLKLNVILYLLLLFFCMFLLLNVNYFIDGWAETLQGVIYGDMIPLLIGGFIVLFLTSITVFIVIRLFLTFLIYVTYLGLK